MTGEPDSLCISELFTVVAPAPVPVVDVDDHVLVSRSKTSALLP